MSLALEALSSNEFHFSLERRQLFMRDQQHQQAGGQRTYGQDREAIRERVELRIHVAEKIGTSKSRDAADGIDHSYRRGSGRFAEKLGRDSPESRQVSVANGGQGKEGQQNWNRLGVSSQAQQRGCRNERWNRAMPAPFALPVRVPAIHQHCDEECSIGQRAEKADVQIRKSGLAFEHGG